MRWLLFILALLFAGAASAAPPTTPANAWTRCSTSTSDWKFEDTSVVSGLNKRCFEFDQGFAAGSTTSFTVTSATASVCAELDVNSTTDGDVRPILYSCPTSLTPALAVCTEKVKTWTASSCVAVTLGDYLISVPTTPVTDTEDAIIAVQGY